MNYVMLKINKNKSTVDYWYLFYNHSAVSHCCIQTIVLLHYKQCGLIPPSPHFFSGHCCIQTVVLSIIDKDGFFDQCSFTLSKQPLTIVQYHTTTEELTTLKEITSSHVRATADIYIMIISVLYIYIIFFSKYMYQHLLNRQRN